MTSGDTLVLYAIRNRADDEDKPDHGGSYTFIPSMLPDPAQRFHALQPVLPFFTRRYRETRRDILAAIDALETSMRLSQLTARTIKARIEEIGRMIGRMMAPVFKLLNDRPSTRNVIVVTNDPAIPWVWARQTAHNALIHRNVGMSFLRGDAGPDEGAWPLPEAPDVELDTRELRDYSMIILADDWSGGSDTRASLGKVKAEVDAIERDLKGTFARLEIIEGTSNGRPADDRPLDDRFLTALEEECERVKVIHYAGHIDDVGNLLLSHPSRPRHLAAQSVIDLPYRLTRRPLVFLNGCASGPVGARWERESNLASAFLKIGAYGAIVSLLPIADRPAARFATSVYEKLIVGERTVGEAIQETRTALLRELDEDDEETSTLSEEAQLSAVYGYFFNLYGDPRIRVVPRGGPSRRRGDLRRLARPDG